MPELLFEIGSEELPAEFVKPALQQLDAAFREKATAANLLDEDASIHTSGTPRRLVLHARGIRARQPDEEVQARGPSVSAAFDSDGNPTRAALGFAQKQNVAPTALERDPSGQYVVARYTKPGQAAVAILSTLLPETIRLLTFPKTMRWGRGKMRFARPIRWILALLDTDVVPFTLEHVSASNKSRGHRFLSPDENQIASPAAYFDRMRDQYVLLEGDARERIIVEQSEALAREAGGVPVINSALLEENVYLTEYPTVVLGGFSAEYLSLPRAVLTTSMAKHQRYFPVEDRGGSLLPKFLAVRNGGDRAIDLVREGYEHVLAARFNDARFFYEHDQTTTLEEKTPLTRRIVFQEKLGSIYEKTLRLKVILEDSGLTDIENSHLLLRAAELCKADLASMMVAELTSLQGVMGREYALQSGENPDVADAIAEHYLPRTAGDNLPGSIMGIRLAIADRIDTLVGYFGVGFVPTGTSDPYGLRRAATALATLMDADPTSPGLEKLFSAAWAAYEHQGTKFNKSRQEAYESLLSVLSQRLDGLLEERCVRYDVRLAVLATDIDNVHEAISRALFVQKQLGSDVLADASAIATRVGNILRFAEKDGISVQAGASVPGGDAQPAENELRRVLSLAALQTDAAAKAADWDAALKSISALRVATDTFFDDVRVMSEDLAERNCRLGLLRCEENLLRKLAAFELIVEQ